MTQNRKEEVGSLVSLDLERVEITIYGSTLRPHQAWELIADIERALSKISANLNEAEEAHRG